MIRLKVALGLAGKDAPASSATELADQIESKFGIKPERTMEIYSNIRDADWSMTGRELAPPK